MKIVDILKYIILISYSRFYLKLLLPVCGLFSLVFDISISCSFLVIIMDPKKLQDAMKAVQMGMDEIRLQLRAGGVCDEANKSREISGGHNACTVCGPPGGRNFCSVYSDGCASGSHGGIILEGGRLRWQSKGTGKGQNQGKGQGKGKKRQRRDLP